MHGDGVPARQCACRSVGEAGSENDEDEGGVEGDKGSLKLEERLSYQTRLVRAGRERECQARTGTPQERPVALPGTHQRHQ